MSMNEKLIRTIQALMAKASDPGVTEAEALAYTEKVQELLAKYNIAMADVSSAGAKVQDDMGGTSIQERWPSESRKQLLRAVCRFYMCEAVGPGRGMKTWTIVGRPTNVKVALDMTDYLIGTTVRLSNEYGRKNRGQGVNVIDFRRGCMARLAERMTEMRREQQQQKAEYQSSGNPGNLPALYENEHRLAREYMRAHMNVTFGKSRSIKEGIDALNGRRAADKIGLHSQVGSSGSVGRLAIGSK